MATLGQGVQKAAVGGKDPKKLDDGWPESVEEQFLPALI